MFTLDYLTTKGFAAAQDDPCRKADQLAYDQGIADFATRNSDNRYNRRSRAGACWELGYCFARQEFHAGRRRAAEALEQAQQRAREAAERKAEKQKRNKLNRLERGQRDRSRMRK